MGGRDGSIFDLGLIRETCSAFRNALMFNNELMADVHFIVGPVGGSQRLPAHKVKDSPFFFGGGDPKAKLSYSCSFIELSADE